MKYSTAIRNHAVEKYLMTYVYVCSVASVLSDSFRLLWTAAHQAPLSMARQEYWRGLPCPPPGALPDPGTEPASLASPALAGGSVTTAPSISKYSAGEDFGESLGQQGDKTSPS